MCPAWKALKSKEYLVGLVTWYVVLILSRVYVVGLVMLVAFWYSWSLTS